MDRRYYSKKHFERLSNGKPDTKERIEERKQQNAFSKQAYDETLAKFGSVTVENAREFTDYQNKRYAELMAPIYAKYNGKATR